MNLLVFWFTRILFVPLLVVECQSSSSGAYSYCPHQRCGAGTTLPPTTQSCNNLSLRQLNVYSHENQNYIELLGPSSLDHAAAMIISVPHGGTLLPNAIENRTHHNTTYCPATTGCGVERDTNTIELALEIATFIIQQYCKVPFLVVNHLHRVKLDANRHVEEAAFGNAIATGAWQTYHDFIQLAQWKIIKRFKTLVNTNETGARGMLLDLHGYAAAERRDDDHWTNQGWIHWGYRLSSETLQECSLSSGGSLSHASSLSSQRAECLIRGPTSLGSRVSMLLLDNHNNNTCGAGLPSYEYPNPYTLQYSEEYCSDPPCKYFTGGYTTKVHSFLNWTHNAQGIHFNTVQAELPACIRLNKKEMHVKFANATATALCSFLRDVFPPSNTNNSTGDDLEKNSTLVETC